MSISLATGSQVAIATTFGSPLAFSAASNASETVLTMASTTGISVGSIVEIVTSGWPLFQGWVGRVKAVVTDTSATMEGFDTASTTNFPAGEGAGTIRVISAFTGIPLIRDAEVSGGEVQYTEAPELAKPRVTSIPSSVSGITVGLPVYFEATASAGVLAAKAAAAAGSPAAIRVTHPAGDVIYANGYWGFRRFPTINRGNPRESQITFAQLAVDEAVYAS